jgi:hypothetical protein
MAYSVEDWLVEQSPMISSDINQKFMEAPTPWITLYSQEFWDDERSSVQRTYQFDRVQIRNGADEVEWEDVTTDPLGANSSGDHNQHQTDTADGIPPSDELAYTETIRDYKLQHKAIWGPPLNVNKLRDKFVRVQQVGASVKALADQAREYWIKRKRDEYKRIADNVVVLDSGFDLTGGDYDSIGCPDYTGTDGSMLTNGFTDEIYEFLNHQGAGKNALGYADTKPVYGLVTSARQSRRLIMSDPEVREDFRYSSQNEKLLQSMGVKWTYNGYSHLIDASCDRWEYYTTAVSGADSTNNITAITRDAGNLTATLTVNAEVANNHFSPNKANMTRFWKYTQITPGSGNNSGDKLIITSRTGANTYKVKRADGQALAGNDSAATIYFTAWLAVPRMVLSGGRTVPNSDWLTATWEDSYIFHQGTCTSLVPRPLTSVGQASFDALEYTGSVRWTNYDNRDDNPDGTIGQFRGVMSNGTRPDNPEFGIVLRHLAVPRPDSRIQDETTLG